MTDTGVFYTTKSGDMLDAIVYGHYDGDVSALKDVLRHPRNRHLMGLGPILPSGVRLFLPALTRLTATSTVQLLG